MKYCYGFTENDIYDSGFESIAEALEEARYNYDEGDVSHVWIGEQVPAIDVINFGSLAEYTIEQINEMVSDQIDDVDEAFLATPQSKATLAVILRKFVEDQGGIPYYTARNVKRYNLKSGEEE